MVRILFKFVDLGIPTTCFPAFSNIRVRKKAGTRKTRQFCQLFWETPVGSFANQAELFEFLENPVVTTIPHCSFSSFSQLALLY